MHLSSRIKLLVAALVVVAATAVTGVVVAGLNGPPDNAMRVDPEHPYQETAVPVPGGRDIIILEIGDATPSKGE